MQIQRENYPISENTYIYVTGYWENRPLRALLQNRVIGIQG